MSYFIRALGTSDVNVDLTEAAEFLKSDGFEFSFSLDDEESSDEWYNLALLNKDGKTVAEIERVSLDDEEIFEEETTLLKEMVEGSEPKNAADWLVKYFKKLKVVYHFELKEDSFEEADYLLVNTLYEFVSSQTGGILQSDGEGFTNENGYHILWQFSDDEDLDGNLYAAVLNAKGDWDEYEFDLSNPKAVAAFKAGKKG